MTEDLEDLQVSTWLQKLFFRDKAATVVVSAAI
jgi:hypothetical protein